MSREKVKAFALDILYDRHDSAEKNLRDVLIAKSREQSGIEIRHEEEPAEVEVEAEEFEEEEEAE